MEPSFSLRQYDIGNLKSVLWLLPSIPIFIFILLVKCDRFFKTILQVGLWLPAPYPLDLGYIRVVVPRLYFLAFRCKLGEVHTAGSCNLYNLLGQVDEIDRYPRTYVEYLPIGLWARGYHQKTDNQVADVQKIPQDHPISEDRYGLIIHGLADEPVTDAKL